MTLEETNAALLALEKEITAKQAELGKVQLQYDIRYHNLIMHSGMGTALLKEAEAKTIMVEEGLYEKHAMLLVDMKTLWNRKDILLEYSKNLRAILHGQSS